VHGSWWDGGAAPRVWGHGVLILVGWRSCPTAVGPRGAHPGGMEELPKAAGPRGAHPGGMEQLPHGCGLSGRLSRWYGGAAWAPGLGPFPQKQIQPKHPTAPHPLACSCLLLPPLGFPARLPAATCCSSSGLLCLRKQKHTTQTPI